MAMGHLLQCPARAAFDFTRRLLICAKHTSEGLVKDTIGIEGTPEKLVSLSDWMPAEVRRRLTITATTRMAAVPGAVGERERSAWIASRPIPGAVINVHGNAIEFVEDCDHASYQGAPTDSSAWIRTTAGIEPRAAVPGARVRGPSASRIGNAWDADGAGTDEVGFRVARTLD